jgi:RIH domain
MIQYTYVTLKYAIQEYRPSELISSQFLELLVEYALSDLDESLCANETLTELIDNNERILEKRIRNTMIDRFIESLAKSKSHKLVQILRAVCINEGRPMKKHQQYIA